MSIFKKLTYFFFGNSLHKIIWFFYLMDQSIISAVLEKFSILEKLNH